MALNLFCYTSLDPNAESAALEVVKAAGAFDYGADFNPSSPVPANEDAKQIAREHTALDAMSLFLVRLANKARLSAENISDLVEELKSGFPDLLVMFENESRR